MSFGSYVDGPFGTSVRTAGALIYGAQLGLIDREHRLVGNVGIPTATEVGVLIIGGLTSPIPRCSVRRRPATRLPVSSALGMGASFHRGWRRAMRTEIGAGSSRRRRLTSP
jgi:hypothetical protein